MLVLFIVLEPLVIQIPDPLLGFKLVLLLGLCVLLLDEFKQALAILLSVVVFQEIGVRKKGLVILVEVAGFQLSLEDPAVLHCAVDEFAVCDVPTLLLFFDKSVL